MESFSLSVWDDVFLQRVQRMLTGGEILVVESYVYGAGSRNYLFFNEMEVFRRRLGQLGRRDCVVVMTSFRQIIEGRVDAALIAAAEAAYVADEYWVVLDSDLQPSQADYSLVYSRAELRDGLKDMLGRRVRIIEEPQYTSEEHSFWAYVPDEDGVVRPGAY